MGSVNRQRVPDSGRMKAAISLLILAPLLHILHAEQQQGVQAADQGAGGQVLLGPLAREVRGTKPDKERNQEKGKKKKKTTGKKKAKGVHSNKIKEKKKKKGGKRPKKKKKKKKKKS